jgi:phage terminase Nu1 subunit (DNA packaging protein)
VEVIVDAKTVGSAIGVSDRTVRRLVQEGIIVKVKNGQYDLVDCTNRYIKHIQEKQSLMDKDTAKLEQELLVEKVLLERAKKRKLEIVVAEMEGVMHRAEDIEKLWTGTVTNFKSRIRALPSKIAPQVQITSDLKEIISILRREIDETLLELSEYSADRFHKTVKDDPDDTED